MSRLTCPSEILEYINKAAEYESKGMHAEQLDQLEDAVRIRPDSAVAHHNLGAALANLGKYDEAEKEFCQAIELAPQNAAQGLAVPVPYMQAEENLIKLRIVRTKEGMTRIEAPRLGALVFVAIGVALAVCVLSSLCGLNGDMQSAKIIATGGYLGAFMLGLILTRRSLGYFTVGASIWAGATILLNVLFRESIGGLTDAIVFSGVNLFGFLAAFNAGARPQRRSQ
jgi:tetratricopeptide (TPR) repeat protein